MPVRGRANPDSAALPSRGDASAGTTEPPIPDIVIRRLPIYVRTLRGLAEEGVTSVSSEELAERIGVSAAQIRRDLSSFGRFGKQGKGYDTTALADAISAILHLDEPWDVAIAGYGNIGRALVHHRRLGDAFRIAAIFDRKKDGREDRVSGLQILPPEAITGEIARLGIEIGIIAAPASAAQDVADRMVAGGVRALLNYAPTVLRVPEGVVVREVDPVAALQSMTYYLRPAIGPSDPAGDQVDHEPENGKVVEK